MSSGLARPRPQTIARMAARKWWQRVKPSFSRFSDVFVGLIVGSGITKVYYETTGAVKENLPIKQQIDEIIEAHDNLKIGRHLRKIDPSPKPRTKPHGQDEVDAFEPTQYGLPLRSPAHIWYRNHVLCYDQARKTPRWVAEHLTREKVKGSASREVSSFQVDPFIPEIFRATNQDFLDSGWSRGHMAAASDSKFDQQAMDETFFLSNIVPQDFENNSGFWYRMEAYSRGLTKRYTNVHVVSGPLYLPTEDEMGRKFVHYEVIGEQNVAVPTHLYKVILADNDTHDPPVLGAFVVPNVPIGFEFRLQDFQVAIEDLEKAAGLIFFPKFDPSTALDLCRTDGCRLMSKEFMERIAFGWKLKNARSVQDLERVWNQEKDDNITTDKFNVEIYASKKKQLSVDECSYVDGCDPAQQEETKTEDQSSPLRLRSKDDESA